MLHGCRHGARRYYTAPIKALVSEKFFDMVDILGRENVGMITGDTTINTEAPVICCTGGDPREPGPARGPCVEGGLRGDGRVPLLRRPDRGWAWQVPLLTLPNAQFC